MLKKLSKTILSVIMIVFFSGSMLVLGGCGAKEEQLNLYVAAGLKKPMDEVVDIFQEETGIKVVPNYGPSGGLYTQIEEGQPCDLYFSADWLYIEKLEEADKVTESEKFLQDNEVVIVSETGKDKVKNVEDLLKPGVTVGICDPNAPVGVYAEKALKKMNLWDELISSGNLKARPSTVNQLAIMVQENELDAGIIYNSVANGFGLKQVQVISQEYSGEIIFGAAIIKGGNGEIAQKFMETASDNINEFTTRGWQIYE